MEIYVLLKHCFINDYCGRPFRFSSSWFIYLVTMHDSWKSGVTITLRLSLLKSRLRHSDRHGGRLITLGAALAAVTTLMAAPGPSGEEGGPQAQEASHHQQQVEDDGGHPGHVHQGACRQYRVIKCNSQVTSLCHSPASLHPERNVSHPAATEASTWSPRPSLGCLEVTGPRRLPSTSTRPQ